jgi:Membrane dipeptidase (Peptidase family M19).
MPHAETLHQVSDCGRVSRCNSRNLHSTVEHFLDHFDHVKKLAGVEHIGVGSDIDLDSYDDMPGAGGDFKRVLAQIWSV